MFFFSCFVGEACSVKLVKLIMSHITRECHFWNLYGPAEATIGSTLYHFDGTNCLDDIPMGKPILNYHCTIKDESLQNVVINQEGELYVGGAGVFAGYLGRDDLTDKALTEIDGEIFYRTGDLVRMDNNGLLHYQGRKDYQIKLHGQRIELGEIERCLLNTSISACVVMKWGDDHLVAYVQSLDMNQEQLREHCQSHLPAHMIPSIFMIVEKLPLNANGKIDRKRLPSPDFSPLTLPLLNESDSPCNQLEEQVHDVWCQVLRHDGQQISTTRSFFSIGGHSLLFIELYHRYQSLFDFDTRQLSIAPFLQQPTIVQHARLLQQITKNDMKSTQWHTLYITQGKIDGMPRKIFYYETFRYRIVRSRAYLS
jgi:hypothetical protein